MKKLLLILTTLLFTTGVNAETFTGFKNLQVGKSIDIFLISANLINGAHDCGKNNIASKYVPIGGCDTSHGDNIGIAAYSFNGGNIVQQYELSCTFVGNSCRVPFDQLVTHFEKKGLTNNGIVDTTRGASLQMENETLYMNIYNGSMNFPYIFEVKLKGDLENMPVELDF